MSTLREALASLSGAAYADLLESEDAYLVVMDLPGATPETTDVRFEDGRLTVEARRDKDVPIEFRYLNEDRPVFLDAELPVPPDAAGSEASASIEGGVLELRVPKGGDAGREIPIE
ncbi:MAG: Hsp20/alpha crystallin family protein [Halobacteriales archaeon]